jgi:hypothetical protein
MKSYEDFYYNLPEEEKAIVSRLRSIVQSVAPELTEKISYNVPYYFRHTRVCFIWPSSVKPGPKSGVALGFCKGYLLSNEQGILEKENRKEVYMITFHSLKDIKENLIREILLEAMLVDQETAKKK